MGVNDTGINALHQRLLKVKRETSEDKMMANSNIQGSRKTEKRNQESTSNNRRDTENQKQGLVWKPPVMIFENRTSISGRGGGQPGTKVKIMRRTSWATDIAFKKEGKEKGGNLVSKPWWEVRNR